MDINTMNAEEFDLFLANSFWPAFRQRWDSSRYHLTWLTIKQSYIQWRDKETDSLLWFVKSFCKGLHLYFGVAMLFCIVIAESSYLIELSHQHLNPCAKDLIEPLFRALPALIGTTILDYALDYGKRPTVTLVAIFSLLALGYIAVCFHTSEPTLTKFYLITIVVVYFLWCIKARDPKMTNLNQNAASVLPGSAQLQAFNSGPNTLVRGNKRIIVKHEEKEMKK